MPLVKMENPLSPSDGLVTNWMMGSFMKVQFPFRVRFLTNRVALPATRVQSGCTVRLLLSEMRTAQRVGVALMLPTMQALVLTLWVVPPVSPPKENGVARFRVAVLNRSLMCRLKMPRKPMSSTSCTLW